VSIFLKTLFQGKSEVNGEIRVVESFGERRLVAAGYTQSRSLNKEGLTGSYWDGFIYNLPKLSLDDRLLVLGLGGGTIAKMLTKKYGNIAIDGVEIDPLMVELGKKYLEFSEKNVNVVIDDALEFLKKTRYQYSIVCVDLFAHGDVAIGSDKAKFFEDIKKVMKKDGLVIINKLFVSKEDLERYSDFIQKIFDNSELLLVKGFLRADNVVIHARN
jgi:spermidine synthase